MAAVHTAIEEYVYERVKDGNTQYTDITWSDVNVKDEIKLPKWVAEKAEPPSDDMIRQHLYTYVTFCKQIWSLLPWIATELPLKMTPDCQFYQIYR